MIPLHVLLSRLAHTLETVRLHMQNGDVAAAANELDKARDLLTQIQGVA